MQEHQTAQSLCLVILQTPLAEKRRVLRFSLLSTMLHAVALAAILAWSWRGVRIPPPAQVISVDLLQHGPADRTPPTNIVTAPPKARPIQPSLPAAALPVPAAVSPVPSAPGDRSHPPVSSSTLQAAPATPLARPTLSETSPAGGKAFPSETPVSAPSRAPAGPSTERSGDNAGVRAHYLQHCRSLIERNKEYPVMARKGRVEGTVIVRSVVARDGSLRQCLINRTSGAGLLDNAALRAVRNVGQFPPPPLELPGVELVLDIPITFRLVSE